MKRKYLSLIIAAALSIAMKDMGESVNATPILNEYQEILTKVDKANSNIQELDEKINLLLSKQEDTKASIDEKSNAINEKQSEIDVIYSLLKDNEDDFRARVRAVYKNGNEPAIEVLTNSKTVGDLIERATTIEKVSKYEKLIIDNIRDNKNKLEKEQSVYNKELKKLNSLNKKLTAQISETEKEKSNQEKLLAEANELKIRYSSELAYVNDANNESALNLRQSTATIASANIASRGGDTNNATAMAVLSEAANHLGKPYAWGAKGPNSFDCSGFVQYVFGKVGINAPAPTYNQETLGRYVPKGQEEPGDLVFFGTPGSTYHVGIYVGNGLYIHAPQTGDVVKYSNLSAAHGYSFARRLI